MHCRAIKRTNQLWRAMSIKKERKDRTFVTFCNSCTNIRIWDQNVPDNPDIRYVRKGEPQKSTCCSHRSSIIFLNSFMTAWTLNDIVDMMYKMDQNGTLYGTLYGTLCGTLYRSVSYCQSLSKSVKTRHGPIALHSALGPASHVPLSGSWPAQLNTMLLSEWRNGGSISGATCCSMFKTQRLSKMLCLSLSMLRSWFVPLILQNNLLTSWVTSSMWHCFDTFRPFPELIWAPKHRFCSSSCWHNATGHRVGIQTPGIHAQTCPAGSRSRCKMGLAVLSVLQTFFFVSSSCGLMIDFMLMYRLYAIIMKVLGSLCRTVLCPHP